MLQQTSTRNPAALGEGNSNTGGEKTASSKELLFLKKIRSEGGQSQQKSLAEILRQRRELQERIE